MASEFIRDQYPMGSSRPEPRSHHASLLRIVRQLTDVSDPDTLMRCLVDEAVALLRGQVGSAACWNEDEGVLKRVWSTIPLVDGRPVDIRPGEGLGGQAIVLRRPVLSNDYMNDPQSLGAAKRAGLAAGIAAPLLCDGEILGALMVGTRDPDVKFSDEDAEALEILAGVAASVVAGLRRARLAGAMLAARTAQHHLNNQLAVTIGYADLLVHDPRLPADLRDYATEILTSAQVAAETVDRLRRVTRLEEADAGSPYGGVLNLARSVGEVDQPSARP
jgi:GAF domain-containing protein